MDINKRLAKLLSSGDARSENLISSYEKRIIEEYSKSLAEIKKQIAAMYERYGDNVTYQQMQMYNRLSNLEQQIGNEIKKLTLGNIKTITEGIKNIFSDSYYFSAYGLEKSIGVNLGFGQLSAETIKASLLNSLDRIKWEDRLKQHAQIYNNQIRSEISQGLIQGKGYSKIAKAIIDKTGINADKIIRIVRTEGHRVQSAGRLIAFDKSEQAAGRLGIKTHRVWLATLDKRTRDSHRYMDLRAAKDINGQKLFTFRSGLTTEGPGLSGIAAEDINCRCTTILEFDDMPQINRKDHISKEIVSYKNYDEWQRGRIAKK